MIVLLFIETISDLKKETVDSKTLFYLLKNDLSKKERKHMSIDKQQADAYNIR